MISRVIDKVDILNRSLWWTGPAINVAWMMATYFFMIPTLAPTHSLVLLATGLSGFWAGLFTALLWSIYAVILFPTSWDRMAIIIANYFVAWFLVWILRMYIRLGSNATLLLRTIYGNVGTAISAKSALDILDNQVNINALHSILDEADALLRLPLDKQAQHHLQMLRHYAAHVVNKVDFFHEQHGKMIQVLDIDLFIGKLKIIIERWKDGVDISKEIRDLEREINDYEERAQL